MGVPAADTRGGEKGNRGEEEGEGEARRPEREKGRARGEEAEDDSEAHAGVIAVLRGWENEEKVREENRNADSYGMVYIMAVVYYR